jgi:hypothetical protein
MHNGRDFMTDIAELSTSPRIARLWRAEFPLSAHSEDGAVVFDVPFRRNRLAGNLAADPEQAVRVHPFGSSS